MFFLNLQLLFDARTALTFCVTYWPLLESALFSSRGQYSLPSFAVLLNIILDFFRAP